MVLIESQYGNRTAILIDGCIPSKCKLLGMGRTYLLHQGIDTEFADKISGAKDKKHAGRDDLFKKLFLTCREDYCKQRDLKPDSCDLLYIKRGMERYVKGNTRAYRLIIATYPLDVCSFGKDCLKDTAEKSRFFEITTSSYGGYVSEHLKALKREIKRILEKVLQSYDIDKSLEKVGSLIAHPENYGLVGVFRPEVKRIKDKFHLLMSQATHPSKHIALKNLLEEGFEAELF